MDYAKEIILNLLKESIEQPKVEDAIRKHYEVEITYTPKRKRKSFSNGTGKRIIQPTTLGISKGGNMVVRAFQPYGDTQTRTPHWKMFDLDRIESWNATNRIFSEPPGMTNAEGKYNANGDKSMATVLLNATFDNGIPKRQTNRNNKPSQKRNNKIAYNNNKGNESSINDMSNAKNFGDENYSQTIGPVTKNSDSNKISDKENDTSINYDNARQNGPVYKDNE